ncbi:glycosyltransferase family 4 protein [Haloarcula argentinensis]|uniref:Glycosyltransferase n=1 Tax=Haloarcula argentinensis TaxID=43776 RepID=A0A847U140_HALAR|nr:glycosyltransferase family 4 protein [Haloarcula argentinensis]NLV11952.1 glycosyltransferase [Haloarcula argentinensis]
MVSVLILYHRANLNPRIELFSEALLADGYDVGAICWDRSGSSNAGSDIVPIQRVGIPGFDMSLVNALVVPLLYIQFARTMWRRDPDAILCAHIALLPLAVFWGAITRTPVVYDVIETYFEGYRARKSWFAELFATVASALEQLCLRGVDGITVIDTNGDILAERYRGYTSNFEIVYNLPRVKQEPRQNGHDGPPVIVYTGLIDDRKGVPTLIEAFAEVSETHEARLLLIGGSVDDTLDRVKHRVRELNLDDAVQFTGQVEYDAVHDLLLDADIAVAPYRRLEVFDISRWNSRKIPDYMNAGLPVIAPDFGGFPQVIDETGAGICVDTSDADKVADAIQELIDNPERARALGNSGRDAIKSRYNWGTECEKVTSVFRTAIRTA